MTNLNSYDLAHFTQRPYNERKVIFMTSDSSYFDEESKLYVLSTKSPLNIEFPQGHPQEGNLYIAHPLVPNKYIPFCNYQMALLEEKLREFVKLVQALGATQVSISCGNSCSDTKASNTVRDVLLGGGWGPFSANANYSSAKQSQTLDMISRHMELNQKFVPHGKPYVPDGLIWYQNEPSWQSIVSQRLSGGLSHHNEIIETHSTQIMSNNEITQIQASVKRLFWHVNGKYAVEKFTQTEHVEDERLSIDIKFDTTCDTIGHINETLDDERTQTLIGKLKETATNTMSDEKVIDAVSKYKDLFFGKKSDKE